MNHRSPTLEGFRTILRRPSFGFAEISWRWSFSAAAALLITLSFLEYLNTLPVSRADLLLFKTRQPTLVGQAIAHVLRGSGFRMVQASIVLALCLAAGWIVIAALGRGATVKALLEYFREAATSDARAANWKLRSLLGLNFLRAFAHLAAIVGCISAFVLGGAASLAGNPAPGATFLVMLTVFLLVWLAWSVVNWILSLASIFVVVLGADTFGSITAAVNLCRDRTGSIFAAGTWFGLAHIVLFFVAGSIVAVPLGFAAIFPPAVAVGGVVVVALLYFAVADFLYVGRLAAYVAIIEFPPEPVTAQDSQPAGSRPSDSVDQSLVDQTLDQSELILSDIPLLGEV
jgi:hypothetical protein